MPVLTRLIHGRTQMSTNEQDFSLLRRYPWSNRVLSGINPCKICIHPCLSIENICTRLVPVFTRSLRWLHGTSRFIHGTNTVDFRPGEKLNMFNFSRSLPDGPGRRPVHTRFVHGLTVRDDPTSHP
jgi:hypothetical protein